MEATVVVKPIPFRYIEKISICFKWQSDLYYETNTSLCSLFPSIYISLHIAGLVPAHAPIVFIESVYIRSKKGKSPHLSFNLKARMAQQPLVAISIRDFFRIHREIPIHAPLPPPALFERLFRSLSILPTRFFPHQRLAPYSPWYEKGYKNKGNRFRKKPRR